MRQEQLQPIAEMLKDAYSATGEYRHTFVSDHGLPPTVAARAHHMRSVMQARLADDERYALHPHYAELGRVQFHDHDHNQVYLLRSRSAVSIEHAKAQRALFDSIEYLKSDVVMIVFQFEREGLALSVAGTRRVTGRKHLEASAAPTFVGFWPFATPEDQPPFDQDDVDYFDELEDEGEGEAGADGVS